MSNSGICTYLLLKGRICAGLCVKSVAAKAFGRCFVFEGYGLSGAWCCLSRVVRQGRAAASDGVSAETGKMEF